MNDSLRCGAANIRKGEAVKRVLLDSDGVLSNFVGAWLSLINAQRGTSFVLEDVTGWDVCASLGITDATERAATKRLIADCPNFAQKHDVLPGAIDGVRRLREIAEVYIVTSPWNSHPTWTSDREAWLKKHFGFPHSHVVHTSAKHLVCGDVLVDDKTDTCEAWREAWPHGIAVQWETPHNRLDVWRGDSTCNWDYLINLVEAMP
jgi:5'(3')-deoxyribonucleotidase